MTKRKGETAAMARRICFAQGVIICPLCSMRLLPEHKVIREHLFALGRGGEDIESNQAYVHKPCADLKTNGKKQTTLGSDKYEIAKTKRLKAGPKERKGRAIPAGRKLQSQGFRK